VHNYGDDEELRKEYTNYLSNQKCTNELFSNNFEKFEFTFNLNNEKEKDRPEDFRNLNLNNSDST